MEIELARLKENAHSNPVNSGSSGDPQKLYNPAEAPQFHLIQRAHPRVVVPKHDEEDIRMTKKTRANWTLPTRNQEIPSAINMMVPLPSAEEMHLLKELSGG